MSHQLLGRGRYSCLTVLVSGVPWSESAPCMHTSPPWAPPAPGHHRARSWAACAIPSLPLAACVTHGGVCMSVPVHPAVCQSVLYIHISVPSLQIGSFVPFFSMHICINIQYLFFYFSLHSGWQTWGPSTSLQMTQVCSFLWLSHIPLCMHNHIFSIQSSLDGHLGCCHVLALVNSVAETIGLHVAFFFF